LDEKKKVVIQVEQVPKNVYLQAKEIERERETWD